MILLSAPTMLPASFKRRGLKKPGQRLRRTAAVPSRYRSLLKPIGWLGGPFAGYAATPSQRCDRRPAGRRERNCLACRHFGGDDEVLVSARGVEMHGKRYVILVATPLEVQTDTMRTVGLLLLAAVPLLVALV
jgi:hypothetical protein